MKVIVDTAYLPLPMQQVVAAEQLIKEGTVSSISDALKHVGIGKSTYYKYRGLMTPANAPVSFTISADSVQAFARGDIRII